jgi:hypothetical protein
MPEEDALAELRQLAPHLFDASLPPPPSTLL